MVKLLSGFPRRKLMWDGGRRKKYRKRNGFVKIIKAYTILCLLQCFYNQIIILLQEIDMKQYIKPAIKKVIKPIRNIKPR